MRQSRSTELATSGRTAPMHTCAAPGTLKACLLIISYSTTQALAAIPVVVEQCAKAGIARQETSATACVKACTPGLLRLSGIRAATEPAKILCNPNITPGISCGESCRAVQTETSLLTELEQVIAYKVRFCSFGCPAQAHTASINATGRLMHGLHLNFLTTIKPTALLLPPVPGAL